VSIVDICIPSKAGIHQEAHGPLISMLQATNCNCRGPRGEVLHQPWKCPNGKHSVRIMPQIYKSSCVHWARNQSVAMALNGQPEDGRPPADYLFLMDDDMVAPINALSRMLSYKRDIVCGICTVRNDPPRPNIRLWSEEQSRFYDPVEWDWDSQKLMEIDGAGAAFMLVKRTVFDRMGKAYLDCEFEIAEDARKGVDTREYWAKKSARRHELYDEAIKNKEWGKTDCWWFLFLANAVDGQIGEMGEDISFCWKAKKLGFKIYADPQVLPGHLGIYAYSIADHIEFIKQAKESGSYSSEGQAPNKPTLEPDPVFA
jgi:hypothetical protein